MKHQDSSSSLLRDATQHRLALSYGRLERPCPLHLQGSNGAARRPIKMDAIGCCETSVTDRHFTLRNNPEEWRSHLQRCGSLRSQHQDSIQMLNCCHGVTFHTVVIHSAIPSSYSHGRTIFTRIGSLLLTAKSVRIWLTNRLGRMNEIS